MAQVTATPTAPHAQHAEQTLLQRFRRDQPWWLLPLTVVTVLGGFGLYVLWTAFIESPPGSVNHVSEWGPYLSPFFSPLIWKSGPVSPAIFVLWSPLIFRASCYYYRKAYYRAFWQSPVACAVPEPRGKYSGETRFPLIMQNAHRYFWFVAVLISLINTWDAIRAFHSPTGFGFGLGNIILVVNVVLLWSYTMGCHSCRHITLGRINHFSKHPVRYWLYERASWLNGRHMQLAWTTLATLVFTDAYIALVSANVISDLRFIG